MPKRHAKGACLAAAMLWTTGAWAAADTPKAKKLYCWDDRGVRVCSDALPPEAVNRARQEFSAQSGMRTGEVDRALSEEERAAIEVQLAQARADEAAAETRRRTDQAMLLSYASEDDLRRVFAERTGLLDNSVQMARYNVTSLREGLVMLLQQAGERELAGRPVEAKLAADIGQRHRDLLQQQRLQANFESQRAALDTDIAQTLQRYRQMKQGEAPASAGR